MNQEEYDFAHLWIVAKCGQNDEFWLNLAIRHPQLLDHVIVINEAHLRRLLRDYVAYYHNDRIHDSLEKDSPEPREASNKPAHSANLISFPRVGGLHHRDGWQSAA
jgi:putative transposase